MGCMGSTDISQNTQKTLIMQVNKMKIVFEVQQNKFEEKAKQQFSQFQAQLNKPIPKRSKDIQKIILQQIVIYKNKRHICNMLQNDCKKIIDNKHFFGNPKYFDVIVPNVREILFAQSILQDQNIMNFRKQLKKKYPQITESQIQDITSDIMRHHKLQEFPTDSMVNDFVLQSCRQNQMNLQRINASGNQFRFGG